MIKSYMDINRIIRSLTKKITDCISTHNYDESMAIPIFEYIRDDVRELERKWPKGLETGLLEKLKQLVRKDDIENLCTTIENIIPALGDTVDDYFSIDKGEAISTEVYDILHPRIISSSYPQFRQEHYRDAVFNAFVAVFDLLRERTNLDLDGSKLAEKALSLDNPILILSNLTTESGKNDQKGFIQILQGVYTGIRNPKAHSLASDLDRKKALQYLIFASLLARRIEEAKMMTNA